jgi:hypothetical protein
MQVVSAPNNALFKIRELSCFCCHYIEDVLGDCTSKGYVDPWRLVKLEPCHATYVLCDVEFVEKLHIVDEDLKLDDFGNFVEKGDEIVIGQYYKHLGRRKSSYMLIKDKGSTFIYFHLICASRFSMIQLCTNKKVVLLFTLYLTMPWNILLLL